MKNKEICFKEKCTACHACEYVCKQHAISFEVNDIGDSLPNIDKSKCSNCGICYRVCPNNKLEDIDFKPIMKAYAAWSNDSALRALAASGGVASTIQINSIRNNYVTYGVKGNFGENLKIERVKENEIIKIANSKYAYTDITFVLSDINEQLKNEKKVLFIGMPCQVAAIKSLYGSNDNLILIDIVCHGMPPISYYKEHCEFLRKKYMNKKFKEIRFRTNNNFDPILLTEEGDEIRVNRFRDAYAIGYHGGAIYRNSCYTCNYARTERISDITLCDYWGLEFDSDFFEQAKKGITAILVNSKKGEEFLSNNCNGITMKIRNSEEVIANNGQLRMPTKITKWRENFLKYYPIMGFEKASYYALAGLGIRQKISANYYVQFAKKIIKGLLRKNGK